MESDARDVRLALPPDFGVILTTPGVVAQPPAVGGIPVAEVQANPPQAVQPQPASGEPLGRWLEDSGLVPSAGQEGVTAVGDRTEREVQLPAGRSIEIAITADPGTEAASRVVVYAIASEDGIAVLRFVGQPGVVSSRAEDLRLIALLAEFGDLAADDRQASQLNP